MYDYDWKQRMFILILTLVHKCFQLMVPSFNAGFIWNDRVEQLPRTKTYLINMQTYAYLLCVKQKRKYITENIL